MTRIDDVVGSSLDPIDGVRDARLDSSSMAKGSHATIVLCKTCSTSWDTEGRVCGRAEIPPSGEGLAELTITLRDAGVESLRESIGMVYCAEDELSKRCAKIMGSSCNAKVKALSSYSELDVGLWEGVLKSDLNERFPRVYTTWVDDPGIVAPPDGESLSTVQGRILEQLGRSIRKSKSAHPTFALVLRPFAFAVLSCWIENRPLSEIWDILDEGSKIRVFSLDRAPAGLEQVGAPKIA